MSLELLADLSNLGEIVAMRHTDYDVIYVVTLHNNDDEDATQVTLLSTIIIGGKILQSFVGVDADTFLHRRCSHITNAGILYLISSHPYVTIDTYNLTLGHNDSGEVIDIHSYDYSEEIMNTTYTLSPGYHRSNYITDIRGFYSAQAYGDSIYLVMHPDIDEQKMYIDITRETKVFRTPDGNNMIGIVGDQIALDISGDPDTFDYEFNDHMYHFRNMVYVHHVSNSQLILGMPDNDNIYLHTLGTTVATRIKYEGESNGIYSLYSNNIIGIADEQGVVKIYRIQESLANQAIMFLGRQESQVPSEVYEDIVFGEILDL